MNHLPLLAAPLLLCGCIHTTMPGESFSAPTPAETPQQRALADALRGHVEMLSVQIGRRHLGEHGNLQRAAAYLDQTLAAMGYAVRSHAWEQDGKPVRNLEVEIPGSRHPAEIILMGAHYDSARQSPGADDNASGVAALLEVARLLHPTSDPSFAPPPGRTVRLVFFTNEEPPFFANQTMGSWKYAHAARNRGHPGSRGENIVAMIALDSIGRFSSEPGSQRYPAIVAGQFPTRGDFLGFVTRHEDARLLHAAIAAFRKNTPVPSQGASAPSFLEGIWYSDHWSFWQFGYPGIMITDTAFFRWGDDYHAPGDTIDQLDFLTLAHITNGLRDIVITLADPHTATAPPRGR